MENSSHPKYRIRDKLVFVLTIIICTVMAVQYLRPLNTLDKSDNEEDMVLEMEEITQSQESVLLKEDDTLDEQQDLDINRSNAVYINNELYDHRRDFFVVTATTGLNLRVGSSFDSVAFAVIPHGAVIHVTNYNPDGFSFVKYGYLTGYVLSEWIERASYIAWDDVYQQNVYIDATFVCIDNVYIDRQLYIDAKVVVLDNTVIGQQDFLHINAETVYLNTNWEVHISSTNANLHINAKNIYVNAPIVNTDLIDIDDFQNIENLYINGSKFLKLAS